MGKFVFPLALAVACCIILLRHVPMERTSLEYSWGGVVGDLLSAGVKLTDGQFSSALKTVGISGDALEGLIKARKAGSTVSKIEDIQGLTATQKQALNILSAEQIVKALRSVKEAGAAGKTMVSKADVDTLVDGVSNLDTAKKTAVKKAINTVLNSKTYQSFSDVLVATKQFDAKSVGEIVGQVTKNLDAGKGPHLRFTFLLDPAFAKVLKRYGIDPKKAASMTDAKIASTVFGDATIDQMKKRVAELKKVKNPTADQLSELRALEDLIGAKPSWKTPGKLIAGAGTIIGIGVGLYFLITDALSYFDTSEDAEGAGRDLDGNCTDNYGFECMLWNLKNWLDDPLHKTLVGGSSFLCSCCCCCMILMMVMISMEENNANAYF
jgi:hypothetical protein